VNYTFDSADRPSTATDSANGITYATDWQTPPTNTNCVATAVCYTPQGSVYGMSIGQTTSFTGFNFSETYNNRLQPGELKASSSAGSAIDITYNFVDPVSTHNAGHVYGITNNLNSSRSQAFTYDQVNRIVSASTTATTGTYCWGYQYTYDAWGNLNAQAGSSGYSGCSEYTSSATAGGNNQLTGLSYDASGNTLSDGSYSYTWNAESQMKTAAGVTYAYDGDGRRAAKVGSTLHWYGSGGEVLSETDTSGNTQNEYIFFGGKRVALVPASGSVLYYAEDMLGSSRVMVESSGTLCYDADFTPFGAERDYTSTCAQNYKFEGKERDPETQNDDFGARKYTWRFGRWLSSDWSAVPVAVPYANLTNPQTLNLYAMVADDPESFADLNGHEDAMIQAGKTGSGNPSVAKQTTQQQAQNPVQVQATVTEQPKIVQGEKQSDGTSVTGVRGTVQDTITVNGKPLSGVTVDEKNVSTTTLNGTAQPLKTIEGPSKTNNAGQINDTVGLLAPARTASADKPLIQLLQTQAVTFTNTNTITFATPGGATYSATSTRTLTNVGPNGQVMPNYTLTTSQPAVTAGGP
jgi:RHS repeat-associated protein